MRAADELPPVSVVVVNFDGAAYLDRCLGAIAALEGPVAEVIVVDNASTDGSVALVEERHPRARLVRLATNEGPAAARNRGLSEAGERWVLLVDNDAVLERDVLVRLATAMRSRERVALVQPRSLLGADPARVHYDGGAFHYVGLIALRNFYAPLAEAEGEGVVEVDCAVSVALLADREALAEVGGFDPGYFILFEDLDLSWKLRTRGWRILSVEDVHVLHLSGTAGISYREGPAYPARRVYLQARNRWRFLCANVSTRTLLAALPGLALYEAASFAFALAVRAPGAWWAGKRDALAQRAELRRSLAAHRAERRVRERELLAGGPLTLVPALAASPLRRGAARVLSGLLALWWVVGRRLA